MASTSTKHNISTPSNPKPTKKARKKKADNALSGLTLADFQLENPSTFITAESLSSNSRYVNRKNFPINPISPIKKSAAEAEFNFVMGSSAEDGYQNKDEEVEMVGRPRNLKSVSVNNFSLKKNTNKLLLLQDYPLMTWMSRRDEALRAMMTVEARTSVLNVCNTCALGVEPGVAEYICSDCFSRQMYCQDCFVSFHAENPLHSIKV